MAWLGGASLANGAIGGFIGGAVGDGLQQVGANLLRWRCGYSVPDALGAGALGAALGGVGGWWADSQGSTLPEQGWKGGNSESSSPVSSKAPQRVQPGVRILRGQYVNDFNGRVEPWVAHYDEEGRLIARTDYNAGNKAAGIPDVHYHLYRWGRGLTAFEYAKHVPGEYEP